MPDLQAMRLAMFAEGNTVCVEWRWTAAQASIEAFDWRGMCVFGVENDRIIWGRLYMAPVEITGHGIDATVEKMVSMQSDRPG